VYQYIESAVTRRNRPGNPFHIGANRDIGGLKRRPRAYLHGGRGQGSAFAADDEHIKAVDRKAHGDGETDPAASTGD
jgi:hypothetical protein